MWGRRGTDVRIHPPAPLARALHAIVAILERGHHAAGLTRAFTAVVKSDAALVAPRIAGVVIDESAENAARVALLDGTAIGGEFFVVVVVVG